MKKNISINLFGTLYQIDEDAYNLLERYLDSMKSYFSRQEGGEEIADDIEHRVAELLWAEKEKGVDAVNIEMIRDIMNKIGDPAQIDGNNVDEGTASTGNQNSEPLDSHPFADGGSKSQNEGRQGSNGIYGDSQSGYDKDSNDNIFTNMKRGIKERRLYRDTSDKMIGGVCSGFSHYFGGDVTIWRLGTIVATILLWWGTDIWWVPGVLGWIIPLGYIVLCFVVPTAHTPEDQLRMRGEEVSPQNINEEIIRESNATQQRMYSQQAPSNGSGCLKALLIVGVVIILFPLLMGLLAMILAVPMFSGIMGSGLFENIFGSSSEAAFFGNLFSSMQWLFWTILACSIILIAIPIALIIRAIRGSKTSGASLLIWALIWFITLIGSVYFISRGFGEIGNAAMDAENIELKWHVGSSVDDDDTPFDTIEEDSTYNLPDSVE